MPDRSRARELASQYIQRGDPLGWFEQLYREAERGESIVPWDDPEPSSHLIDFWRAHSLPSAGKTALIVACGLGQDAEQIASWGFRTTAFDISATAIKEVRKRFPRTAVNYVVADLFEPPPDWNSSFDFVFETSTLQALPSSIRPKAIESIARFVKPGGLLLVIARGRQESDPEGQLPWRLTRSELARFTAAGLIEQSFDVASDPEAPDVRRFRASYLRPSF